MYHVAVVQRSATAPLLHHSRIAGVRHGGSVQVEVRAHQQHVAGLPGHATLGLWEEEGLLVVWHEALVDQIELAHHHCIRSATRQLHHSASDLLHFIIYCKFNNHDMQKHRGDERKLYLQSDPAHRRCDLMHTSDNAYMR